MNFFGLFGNDVDSLLKETYDLKNKYISLKERITTKLAEFKATKQAKKDAHNVAVAKLKEDYESKVKVEFESHTASISATDADVNALEHGLKHVDKILTALTIED